MTNADSQKIQHFNYIIVGGGIAGTTCAEKLCTLSSECKVLLLSSSATIKAATNLKSFTKFLCDFDIVETKTTGFTSHKNLTIYHQYVCDLDAKKHNVICNDGSVFAYDKLCICTGGSPKLIDENNPFVIGIRDTETVQELQNRMTNARQIILVGNGGIATELAYEIEHCQVLWVIKDTHISHLFFDAHVAKFFEKKLNADKDAPEAKLPAKRTKYTITKLDPNDDAAKANTYGSALGPDWQSNLTIKGQHAKSHQVKIEYNCTVKKILPRELYLKEQLTCENDFTEWPVYVQLSNDKIYGCDFIVSATGVSPAVEPFLKHNQFVIAQDGGLQVNEQMQSSIPDVYAAGDACTVLWPSISSHWFQMRLWNQARQMGDYAARAMLSDKPVQLDFCFELFAHITKFFNFKVILLGNYDARELDTNDYHVLLRCTENVEYVKVVVHRDRVSGALLIGETNLEETLENLILNQIDVSPYGEDLINPDIDIEDYFD